MTPKEEAINEFTDQTCSPRLKRLMDISHIVPLIFFFFSQLLIWLHPRVNKLNVIHGNSSLLLSLPISPPPHLFLFSLPMWTLSLCREVFCTFKATYIRKKRKNLLWIQLKSHMNGTSELSPFNPQRGRKKKKMFLAECSNISNIKNPPCSIQKKKKKKKKK